MNEFITILTPTYNRQDKICELFKSLESQTEKSFKWLIIDDGSSDNTPSVVESFTKSASFDIEYFQKKNGGKHTALNLGISQIDTPLLMIVDSDDTLTTDAILSIRNVYSKYGIRDDLCGYSFLRQFPDGAINGKKFDKDELIGSYIEVRVNGDDMNADKAEVYFSARLKECPFPEFDGERFIGEDVVWARLSSKYKMVHLNKPIYIGEYLTDGLTSNRRINNLKSPRGCMVRANGYLIKGVSIGFKIKCALQYFIYGKFCGIKTRSLIADANDRFMVFICAFPAWLIYLKWNRKYGGCL